MSKRRGEGTSSERAVSHVLEVGWAIFGSAVAVSISEEFFSKICEKLFDKYKAEPRCTKGSEKYFIECLELVLRDKYARELFYWIGRYFLLFAPLEILETPEVGECIEKLCRVLKEGDRGVSES
jgi:hypothetical protein